MSKHYYPVSTFILPSSWSAEAIQDLQKIVIGCENYDYSDVPDWYRDVRDGDAFADRVYDIDSSIAMFQNENVFSIEIDSEQEHYLIEMIEDVMKQHQLSDKPVEAAKKDAAKEPTVIYSDLLENTSPKM